MPEINAIYTSVVKSLALESRSSVYVGPSGIVEDRRFFLIDGGGRLLTQRQRPQLSQVTATYEAETDLLRLAFPNGQEFFNCVEEGEPVSVPIWGRLVPGRVVVGEWNEFFSDLCRGPVRLVKADGFGLSYDEFPISILSQASLDFLGQRTGGAKDFEARRFRPNLLLEGCSVHEEDRWLGTTIAIGPDLKVRVVSPDPRCAITTVDPDTGQRDFDTPRLLLSYRPGTRAPYFGVYAVVESPGKVRLGDSVNPEIPTPDGREIAS